VSAVIRLKVMKRTMTRRKAMIRTAMERRMKTVSR
jgi:hypothetical protein